MGDGDYELVRCPNCRAQFWTSDPGEICPVCGWGEDGEETGEYEYAC